jgi:hypothetical protein
MDPWMCFPLLLFLQLHYPTQRIHNVPLTYNYTPPRSKSVREGTNTMYLFSNVGSRPNAWFSWVAPHGCGRSRYSFLGGGTTVACSWLCFALLVACKPNLASGRGSTRSVLISSVSYREAGNIAWRSSRAVKYQAFQAVDRRTFPE